MFLFLWAVAFLISILQLFFLKRFYYADLSSPLVPPGVSRVSINFSRSHGFNFFSQYYLPPLLKRSVNWKTFHVLSKAHSFDALSQLHCWKYAQNMVGLENIELNITVSDMGIIFILSCYNSFNKNNFEKLVMQFLQM